MRTVVAPADLALIVLPFINELISPIVINDPSYIC
jgi:hypothetical protein